MGRTIRPSHLASPELLIRFPSPFLPQILPEGLLLWPRLLCQHGGGEHGREGGQNEVGRDHVYFLHAAVPLHELPGAPGQVRRMGSD